jgi:tRNA-specific adenosine deaminase 2
MSDHHIQSTSSPPNDTDYALDEYHRAFVSKYPYDPAAMEVAFEQARNALVVGEAAIGCVFIDVSNYLPTSSSTSSLTSSRLKYGRVAAVGHNLTNAEHNALAHAEFVAIRSILDTATTQQQQQLNQSESEKGEFSRGGPYVLYVTVEPCIMCGSMLAQSGMVAGVYFGCSNPRFGGNGTVLSVHRSLTATSTTTTTTTPSPPITSPTYYESYYASIGGYRAEEAVGLLQNFYSSENPAAPEERRKRKPNQDAAHAEQL